MRMPSPHTESTPSRRLPPRIERPQIRTTYQLAAELAVPSGETPISVQQRALRIVVEWVQSKYADPLPAAALKGESCLKEMPGGASQFECIGLPERGVWCMRFLHPDLPFDDRPAVPGRTWTVEVALRSDDQTVRLAVHVMCASQPGADEPITLTRPGFVTRLARTLELRDIWPLRRAAWNIDEAMCRDLAYLLTDPDRQLPVHVLTEMDPSKQYELKSSSRFALDADKMANTLFGIAHVVVLDRRTARLLSTQLGRDWSVFGGATRSYMPHLDLAESAHSDHPLVLIDRMARFQSKELVGFRAFGAFLERRSREWAGGARFDWAGCTYFVEAQQMQMEVARRTVTSIDDLRRLIEEQAETYEGQLKDKEEEALSWLDVAANAEKERDYFRDQNRRLTYQLDLLRSAIARGGAASESSIIPAEPRYDELPDWVEEHFVSRLELHPRAKRTLKDARFEEPRLVFEAIELLATHYRDSRIAVEGAQEAFTQGLASLGLELGGSISEGRAGAEGKTYFVKWPLHGVGEEFLESALKKGSNKDERYTLRIYFFWDDESRQVVVGSLPGHLINRMT